MRTRRRRSSAGSQPRESTRPPASALPGTTATPRQDPCRAPGKALADGVSGAIARPTSTKTTTAVRLQLPARPAGQAPAWRHAASRPAQQTPTWWHANLREDPTITPSQQPASLRGAACLVGLDACRSKMERRRTGRASLPSPIKQRDTIEAHLMRLVP